MELNLPDGMSPEDMHEEVDRHLAQQRSPDAILLDGTIEALEQNTGDFNMEDVIQKDGGTVEINGQEVVLNILEVGFSVSKDDAIKGVDHMFDMFFKPAAIALRDMIDSEGCNVCRPIGIVDPSLIAQGLIQLCRRGHKISVFMSHKFRDGKTQVKLQMLVGKI